MRPSRTKLTWAQYHQGRLEDTRPLQQLFTGIVHTPLLIAALVCALIV
jgi:hypothetical protein